MDRTGKMKVKEKFIPEYLREMTDLLIKVDATLDRMSEDIAVLRGYEVARNELVSGMAEKARNAVNKEAQKEDSNALHQETTKKGKGGAKKG